jgi:hypothetical protein
MEVGNSGGGMVVWIALVVIAIWIGIGWWWLVVQRNCGPRGAPTKSL